MVKGRRPRRVSMQANARIDSRFAQQSAANLPFGFIRLRR